MPTRVSSSAAANLAVPAAASFFIQVMAELLGLLRTFLPREASTASSSLTRTRVGQSERAVPSCTPPQGANHLRPHSRGRRNGRNEHEDPLPNKGRNSADLRPLCLEHGGRGRGR